MRYADQTISPQAALKDLENADPKVRVRAADALGKVDGELTGKACSALRAHIWDDDPDVRYTVALALGELRDMEAVEDLIDAILGDGHPLPRQAAVIALGLIGDPRATKALIRMLKEASPDVRFQAATSLLQVNPAKAAGPLRHALKDEDAEVRASAAAAMGDLGDPRDGDRLVPLLEDPVPEVQIEAAVSLARLGDLRGTPVLIEALDRGETRYLAAEHLYLCPDPTAVPQLKRLLGRWLTPALLKVWLAGSLIRMGDKEAEQDLRKSLTSRRSMVRGLTIEVMGDLGKPWADQALQDLANSRDGARWREEIQEALAREAGS